MFNWTQKLADWFVFDILKLSTETHFSKALNFFIYDSIKILILLSVIIFLMGIINKIRALTLSIVISH